MLCDKSEAKAWFEAFCQHRCIHHVFHYGCAVHSDLVRNRVEKSTDRNIVAHKAAAIGLLKDKLDTLDDDTDLDAILLTVLTLASNELDEASMSVGTVLPFEAHVPTARWMTVYGRLETVETHAKAMFLLIHRIGGLQNIRLPGLAHTIAYADLINASVHHRRPALDCWWQSDEPILRAHSRLRTPAGNTPGRAFFTRIPGSLPPKVISLLVRLATLDRYMAQSRNEELSSEAETHLIDTRNALHHALLSLDPFSELAEDDRHGARELMYELCRTTAVLYSNAVLMGVPPHLGWHLPLVKLLRSMLESCRTTPWLDDATDILVWALCVGGLAAWRSPHRSFFETYLKDIIRRRKLVSWTKIQRIVEDFLWSEAACKHGAAMLWLAL